jgi:hypothetical protein
MQLKIRRSQKSSLTGNPIFILDVMAEVSDDESALVRKYKLQKEMVYSSEKADQNSANARGGNLGALGSLVMDKITKRFFTMGDLINGQHLECKDLPDLMQTEAQVHQACQNIRAYLDVAKSFDGSEQIVEIVAA